MSIELPYGSGLGACNQRIINSLNSTGFKTIDGGAAKCRKIDSFFYDRLVSLGYRGKSLSENLEADWIIAKHVENDHLSFSYINPIAGSADFVMKENVFSISGRTVNAVKIDDGVKHKIKVGPSAAKNIAFIFNNKESFLNE